VETLKLRINEAVKAAMRAGDKPRVGTLRLINAAIKQREVDERISLDDTAVIGVLEKMAKQRRESMTMYQQGGRADLVAQEAYELALIQSYLPQPLGEAELANLIAQALSETGATTVKDMGRVMAALKPSLQGRADMAVVSAKLKDKLS
jgi:uncharacterized protein